MKIKLLIWSLFFLPIIYLIFYFPISNDPVKLLSDVTGITSVQFLIATLIVSPLKKYFALSLHQRRVLGLMSFFYAFCHMFLYLLLDHELSLLSLLNEALDKWFIFFGMSSLFILLFLALTSSKKRFAHYYKWHQLIYVAVPLISTHFLMSQKIITIRPIVYVSILIFLLLIRSKKIIKIFQKSMLK